MDILIRDDTRMCGCLDRIVLGRKSERVKADRKQYIVSLHATLPRNDLDTGICFNMSDMHAGSTRIRELYQTVKLRLLTSVHCLKDFLLRPFLLPFGLNLFKFVSHMLLHCFLFIHRIA